MVIGLAPPLDPSGEEARTRLRDELLRPEYRERTAWEALADWVADHLAGGFNRAANAPPLTALGVMIVAVALIVLLGWLLSRIRRTARGRERDRSGPVFTDETLTAAQLRRRAEAALVEGRFEDAVLDGFRAFAARQTELGRRADTPGATAREIAEELALALHVIRDEGGGHDALVTRVRMSAALFDGVCYGNQQASPTQAREVLALDHELAVKP